MGVVYFTQVLKASATAWTLVGKVGGFHAFVIIINLSIGRPGKETLDSMERLDNLYLDGFHAWLKNHGMTDRSADSYTSGINRVNEEYFKPLMKGKDMFDALPDAITTGDAVTWLTSLEAFITHDIEKTVDAETKTVVDITKRKNLQDKRSKLRKFIDYIEAIQDEFEEVSPTGNQIDEKLNEYIPEGIQYYSKDDLRKNFRLRILTQDRLSDGKSVFFPIRLINRLFTASGKKENIEILANLGIKDLSGNVPTLNRKFKEWVKHLVDNIVFHTYNRTHTLSTIDGLIIDSKKERAYIKVGNKNFELFSETPDGTKVSMEVKSLRNIHLDHTKRMEDILNELAGILPIMQRLTSLIRETIKGEKRERKSKEGNVIIEVDKYRPGTIDLISSVFTDKVKFEEVAYLLPLLLVELNYIGTATELVAMSDKLNLQKH